MFVFGVHIASQETFDRHCLPAIASFGGSDATLITSSDTPIARTYNEMLAASLEMEDVEAVVLLREDVEIADPRFLTKVREAFARDPRLAVIGPIGGNGSGLRWWQGPGGEHGAPKAAHAVDCVDGLCMILRPDLAARLRFDDVTFTGTSGYDVDYCFRVRDEGFGVAVAPIDVIPHGLVPSSSGGLHSGLRGIPAGRARDDDESFRSAAAAWQGRRAADLGAATLRRIAQRVAAKELDDSPQAGSVGGAPAPEAAYDVTHSELLAHLPHGIRRVLDVGCGSGTLGAAVKAASGAHVTGIEYGPQAAALARERLDEVHEIDLTALLEAGSGQSADGEEPRLPWEPEPYDVVILADVLARVADPEAVLRLLAGHLHDDGVVIATVPNVKHWSVLLPLLLEDRWEIQDSGPLQRANLRFFTMTEVAGLFRGVGLGEFDACAAQKLPLADPSQLEPLLTAIGSYGADATEAETLINSYQYVIVARRTR